MYLIRLIIVKRYITANLGFEKLSNDVTFVSRSYASIQATAIVQFQLKILSLFRS